MPVPPPVHDTLELTAPQGGTYLSVGLFLLTYMMVWSPGLSWHS
jgi:hypothetical protein